MPAAVIPIGDKRTRSGELRARSGERRAVWSLLEVAQPGRRPQPLGILLVDEESGDLTLRLRKAESFDDLEEQEIDILDLLADDLRQRARETDSKKLLDSLEDSLSNFLRISDRTAIVYAGTAQAATDRLFDQHVDAGIRPFVSHIPLYSLKAAATKFGTGGETEQEGWVRAPERLRLTPGMFAAYVVGRSMEPRIPDGSLCLFRAPVTGTRQGKLLLIEQLKERDFSLQYTIKRYARHSARDESADREAPIRLEPLNPEFPAFDLESDEFRVIAEFVQVLES